MTIVELTKGSDQLVLSAPSAFPSRVSDSLTAQPLKEAWALAASADLRRPSHGASIDVLTLSLTAAKLGGYERGQTDDACDRHVAQFV